MSVGWVYILSNKSLKGQVKIGYTTTHSTERASELQTTGVPTPFFVEYEVKSDDCERLEKSVHTQLKNKRVAKNREFFRVDVPTAIAVVKECVQDNYISEKIYYQSPEEIQKAKRDREQTYRKAQLKAELKTDTNLRVSLIQTKLLSRISELNESLNHTNSKIAILPNAKNKKSAAVSDLEIRIGNNHALLNGLLLKSYFWEKYITEATMEHHFPKSLDEFNRLLSNSTSMGVVIANDLFPVRVKLHVGNNVNVKYSIVNLSPEAKRDFSMKYDFYVYGSKIYSGYFDDPEMKEFLRKTPMFVTGHCWNKNFGD